MADQNIDDALSYPILTEEITSPSKRPSGSPGPSGSSQYGQVVEGALRDILGWRTRTTDPKGFVAALTQSFEPIGVDGQTKWKWTPHSYAIQADLGAITGAQAAIYARAKVALDQALPLLAGLKPLRSDPDLQDMEAIRAVVRSGLTELVHELGEEGGPRIARVDEYFDRLLMNTKLRTPEQLESQSQLGLLRDAFGLARERVNTIDEEQNLTNFFILVDYVNSLQFTWRAQRDALDRRGPDVFLGTQLVLLSRSLTVVAESVQQTYMIMDSVFLGAAERDITELRLKTDPKLGKGSRVFLGELLNWVEHFALEEGPRLIQEGGKDGVVHSFRPTINKLSQMVAAAATLSREGSGKQTAAFKSTRVSRVLEELSDQLHEAFKLANQIKRDLGPSVTNVVPDVAVPTNQDEDVVELSVIGQNFKRGANVFLERGRGGTANRIDPVKDSLIFVDEAEIRVKFDLEANRESDEAKWSLVVTNPDGQADAKPFTIE